MREDMIDHRERNKNYVRKSRAKLTIEQKQYRNQNYCRSWNGWIKRHVYSALIEDRKKSRFGNITPKQIMGLYEQSKCCSLSGVELTYNKSLWSLSIDRINNSIGHIIENVQLTCIGINLAKNRHINEDVKYLITCLKNKDLFIPNKISRNYVSVIRRNIELRDTTANINTDFLLELYDKQSGRCALTNIKLACYPHPMLSVSVDRIDNNLGHTIGNIRLVIKAINRARKNKPDTQVMEWLDDLRSK